MTHLLLPHPARDVIRRGPQPRGEASAGAPRSLSDPDNWPPDWDDGADDEPDPNAADDSETDPWDAFELEDEPDPEPGDFWGELDDDED
ncbi:MAG TPA: hypothetical protein VG056_11985 [Pirellulales bacterium]|jgi:hypothetical protein|nr:hypothetical protein [Pirellulales bacterium]